MEHEPIVYLFVEIDGSSISERRLNDITLKLKSELSHLKPLTVELQRNNSAPEGTMSVEAFTAGTLALAILPTMMPAIIQYLRDWCLRNANRTITLKKRSGGEEIEVSFPEHLSPERLQKFIGGVSSTMVKPDTNNHK